MSRHRVLLVPTRPLMSSMERIEPYRDDEVTALSAFTAQQLAATAIRASARATRSRTAWVYAAPAGISADMRRLAVSSNYCAWWPPSAPPPRRHGSPCNRCLLAWRDQRQPASVASVRTTGTDRHRDHRGRTAGIGANADVTPIANRGFPQRRRRARRTRAGHHATCARLRSSRPPGATACARPGECGTLVGSTRLLHLPASPRPSLAASQPLITKPRTLQCAPHQVPHTCVQRAPAKRLHHCAYGHLTGTPYDRSCLRIREGGTNPPHCRTGDREVGHVKPWLPLCSVAIPPRAAATGQADARALQPASVPV